MDFQSPPSVMEALTRRVEHGVFGYSVPPDELVEVVVNRLEVKYGWRIEPEWLVWIPGLVSAIHVACRAVGNDGDAVLTTVPVYPPFLSAPKYSRRNLIRVPLVNENNRWIFDFDLLEDSITPSTKLLLLCSPHNPTGRLFNREELRQIAEICERRHIIICSDEIHCDLILDEGKKHVPTASLDPEVAGRTITLMAPSKTYNIAGLGCAFAVISNPSLRRRFRLTMAGIVPDVNIMGYAAALAAYRDGNEWLEAVSKYLRSNRDAVTRAVDEMPGLSMCPVEATYLAWIDAREAGLDDAAQFFEEAGVGLSDGRDFGTEGFLRLNFACTRSMLSDALERMHTAIENKIKDNAR